MGKKTYYFDTLTNKLLGEYESINKASYETLRDYNAIYQQCYNFTGKGGGWFKTETYFSPNPKGTKHSIVIAYDTKTGEEIGRYIHLKDASEKTGISRATIARHVEDRLCKRVFIGVRFKKVFIGGDD